MEGNLDESLQSVESESFVSEEEEIGEDSASFDNITIVNKKSESYTSTPLSHYECENDNSRLTRVKRRLFTSTENIEVKIMV